MQPLADAPRERPAVVHEGPIPVLHEGCERRPLELACGLRRHDFELTGAARNVDDELEVDPALDAAPLGVDPLLTRLLHVLSRLYIIIRSKDATEISDSDMRQEIDGWHASIGTAILESCLNGVPPFPASN